MSISCKLSVLLYKIIISVGKKIKIEYYRCFYRFFLKHMGKRSCILSPLHIDGPENIHIGNDVIVREHTWLASVPLTGSGDSVLKIDDGTVVGHFNHIYATKKIVIEENVLIADKVYISDNFHGYENIHIPIKNQPIQQKNEVLIGAGTWIGENSCILGVRIGKQCVIAANSVVTKDIPDFCVAAGVPAKIIKRFCVDSQMWCRTDEYGEFN